MKAFDISIISTDTIVTCGADIAMSNDLSNTTKAHRRHFIWTVCVVLLKYALY